MKNYPFIFEDFKKFNLSPKVIIWIYENFKAGSTILELGSGKSSRELAKIYKVYSIEHNQKYCIYGGVNYIYAPIKKGWYDTNILKTQLPDKYDLIIIDGPLGWNPFLPGRRKFFDNLNLFKDDIPMIFDDYQRKGEKNLVYRINNLLKREIKIISDRKKETCILLK